MNEPPILKGELPPFFQVRRWGIHSDYYYNWLRENLWFIEETCKLFYPPHTAMRNAHVTIAHLLKNEQGRANADIAENFGIPRARVNQLAQKTYRKAYYYLKKQVTPKNNEPEKPRDLDCLNLSVRTYNALKGANIRTIEKLCKYSAKELLSFKNFGYVALKDVEKALSTLDLELADNDQLPTLNTNTTESTNR